MKAGTRANVMDVEERFLVAHLKGSYLMNDFDASKVLMNYFSPQ